MVDPATPALCALLYGPEENGHRECHEYLITETFNDGETSTVRGRPPTLERYGLSALIQWVSNQVLDPGEAPPDTVAGLAASVDQRLEDADFYLVLTDVHLFESGLSGFHETFWRPLCEELSSLRQRRGTKFRLYLLVGAVGAWQADWDDVTERGGEVKEPTKIQDLPALGAFLAKDVKRWLDDMKIEDEPPGRRELLVKTVLARADGTPDATPANVFRRILDLPIWL